MLAADREPVAGLEPLRLGEVILALPVEVPPPDAEQHLLLPGGTNEGDAATLAESMHVVQDRVDDEPAAEIHVPGKETEELPRIDAVRVHDARALRRDPEALRVEDPCRIDERCVDRALFDRVVELQLDDGTIRLRHDALEVVVDLQDEARARLDSDARALRKIRPQRPGHPAGEELEPQLRAPGRAWAAVTAVARARVLRLPRLDGPGFLGRGEEENDVVHLSGAPRSDVEPRDVRPAVWYPREHEAPVIVGTRIPPRGVRPRHCGPHVDPRQMRRNGGKRRGRFRWGPPRPAELCPSGDPGDLRPGQRGIEEVATVPRLGMPWRHQASTYGVDHHRSVAARRVVAGERERRDSAAVVASATAPVQDGLDVLVVGWPQRRGAPVRPSCGEAHGEDST